MLIKFREINFARWAHIAICAFAALAAAYLLFTYAAGIVMPFVIAWMTAALIINPLTRRIHARVKLPRKLISVLLILLLLIIVGILIFLAGNRLLTEIQRFISAAVTDGEAVSDYLKKVNEFFSDITSKIPLLDRLSNDGDFSAIWGNVQDIVAQVLNEAKSKIGVYIPELITNIVKKLPGIVLSVFITLIASFYFALNIDDFHNSIKKLLPAKTAEKLPDIKRNFIETAVRYLRAYLLIICITFFELLVGFSILGIPYAMLFAIIIAIIDILPVLGTGTALLPWAAVCLIAGNYYHGFGLLILYGVVTLVRQLAEPKIVGGSLGIHPLAALFSMYAGLKLLGIFGMIIGPAAAILIKNLFFTPKNAEKPKTS